MASRARLASSLPGIFVYRVVLQTIASTIITVEAEDEDSAIELRAVRRMERDQSSPPPSIRNPGAS